MNQYLFSISLSVFFFGSRTSWPWFVRDHLGWTEFFKVSSVPGSFTWEILAVALQIHWAEIGLWRQQFRDDAAAGLDATSVRDRDRHQILSKVEVKIQKEPFLGEKQDSQQQCERINHQPTIVFGSCCNISKVCLQPEYISLHICRRLSRAAAGRANFCSRTHSCDMWSKRKSSSKLGQQGCFEYQSHFLGAQI